VDDPLEVGGSSLHVDQAQAEDLLPIGPGHVPHEDVVGAPPVGDGLAVAGVVALPLAQDKGRVRQHARAERAPGGVEEGGGGPSRGGDSGGSRAPTAGSVEPGRAWLSALPSVTAAGGHGGRLPLLPVLAVAGRAGQQAALPTLPPPAGRCVAEAPPAPPPG